MKTCMTSDIIRGPHFSFEGPYRLKYLLKIMRLKIDHLNLHHRCTKASHVDILSLQYKKIGPAYHESPKA